MRWDSQGAPSLDIRKRSSAVVLNYFSGFSEILRDFRSFLEGFLRFLLSALFVVFSEIHCKSVSFQDFWNDGFLGFLNGGLTIFRRFHAVWRFSSVSVLDSWFSLQDSEGFLEDCLRFLRMVFWDNWGFLGFQKWCFCDSFYAVWMVSCGFERLLGCFPKESSVRGFLRISRFLCFFCCSRDSKDLGVFRFKFFALLWKDASYTR